MQLTFHGAAGEVTGSCTLLTHKGVNVLIDFGLHQGGFAAEVRNRRFGLQDLVRDGRIHAVILTHAHIDHSGRLPLLAQWGYKGPIYTTPASIDLAGLLLRDSAHVQDSDMRRASRYRQNAHRPPVTPLYSDADVENTLPLFKGVPYEHNAEIAPGISIRFFDAGHILGSASLEITVQDQAERRVIVFSADLGPHGVPLMRDPTPPKHADVLILESTYGDRNHRSLAETITQFEQVISTAIWDKEKVMIPAFAVGRTQQMLFHLGNMLRAGKVPRFPVYVDSPMAISATELYNRNETLFDAEAAAMLKGGIEILDDPAFTFTRSGDESRKLNELWGPAVIIASSGMCTGGRIVHHLRHNLWRKGTHVLIAGYQSVGSLGRKLVDGAKEVRIMGEVIPVRSTIHTLGGFSAHAGQEGLLGWAGHLAGEKSTRVFLNHGENPQRHLLSDQLERRFGWKPQLPVYQQMVEI